MSKAKMIKCCICDDELNKISTGLNKKLLSKNSKQYYCLSCLPIILMCLSKICLKKSRNSKSRVAPYSEEVKS